MPIDAISHPFYDFEVEHVDPDGKLHLVKILSIDGRRFTYEVRSELTEGTVDYIKSLIDSVVFSDLVIERSADGYEAKEATTRLKKHS
jgi:hypothetical protein